MMYYVLLKVNSVVELRVLHACPSVLSVSFECENETVHFLDVLLLLDLVPKVVAPFPLVLYSLRILVHDLSQSA